MSYAMSSAMLKGSRQGGKIAKSGLQTRAGADSSFDLLSDVAPGRESWRFIVRVVRLWEVPAFLHPDQVNSVEMVLVDEKGVRIHATVRKQLLYLFQKKLVEGVVYKLSYFSVAPSCGSYRTTPHAYKLFFQMKTKVNVCEGHLLPLYGLSLTSVNEIVQQTVDSDFLVDVIGLMTGKSDEREYIRDGKVTKMLLLQITDHSGKCEIALFGDYVDDLKKLMAKAEGGLPVLVMQFAKLKIFRDVVSLQNVMNTTRILINPDIPEVVEFKKGLDASTIGSSSSVPIIGPRGRPPLAEDFLRLYPKKTIAELREVGDNETFTVCAVVDGIIEGEDWWYPACKCHRSVTPDSGAYYCKGCVRHIFQIVPRYKVKLRVSDESDEAIFVVFDTDMQLLLDKQCAVLVESSKAENAGFVPSELDKLVGMTILFKVMTGSGANPSIDGSFRVRRVCIDEAIIELFLGEGEAYSPSKLCSCSMLECAIGHNNTDLLSDVVLGRKCWRFVVRIVRLWEVHSFKHPEFVNSLEMVLVDRKGCKIHATVKKQFLYLFRKTLVEGEVYDMSSFSVVVSGGSHRTTSHTYTLFFQMRTKVKTACGHLIPKFGLTLTNIKDVICQNVDNDFLIDVIGLITGLSDEEECVRDGKVTRMILLQLTDRSGKCEMSLIGDYVDRFKQLVAKSDGRWPLLVVQFAKVNFFIDYVSLHSVINTTLIMIDPDIPDVVEFKKGLDVESIGHLSCVPLIYPKGGPTLADDFLRLNPKIAIVELEQLIEVGSFIVYATVDGMVDGESWWYPSCKRHHRVTYHSGVYYCKECGKHIFEIVPRYSVKLLVSDETGEAIFVVSDADINFLLDRHCASMVDLAKGGSDGFYPSEMDELEGLMMLFKIRAGFGPDCPYGGCFMVDRVCMDQAIIELFLKDSVIYSPTEGAAISPSDAASLLKVDDSFDLSRYEDLTSDSIPIPDLNDDELAYFVSLVPLYCEGESEGSV